MCSYCSEPEITAHFLLRCQNHITSRSKLRKNVYNLDQTLRSYDDEHLIHTLLYGSPKFNFNLNKEIIDLTFAIWKIPKVSMRVCFLHVFRPYWERIRYPQGFSLCEIERLCVKSFVCFWLLILISLIWGKYVSVIILVALI